jgi:hypothetical protein
MKQSFILVMLFALLSIAASCEPTPPRDELGQLVDAEFRATESALQSAQSALQLKKVAVEATSRADATRQYLILQGQQTRVAQEANATATAQSANSTATVQAAQRTATVHAQNVATTATAHAQNVATTATAYAQNIAATATAQAVMVNATQVSASATATANAANAQMTRTSADATATVVAANVIVEQERAAWNQRLESLRAIASFLGVVLVLVGALVIIGFGVIRFIDAGVLRARVLRDKTGTVLVIGERDKDGRQMVLIPGRSPGAALTITPPDAQPLQIEAGAVDEETTKRDQAISLMIAATRGKGGADDLMDELTTGEQVKLVDEPPPQLVSGEVKQLLDGDWQRAEGGGQ